MRWMITGAAGMLGTDAQTVMKEAGHDVVGLRREDLDITDAAAVDQAVASADVVLNCAAYTAVDAAESDEATAFNINALGPANLARAAAHHGATLVHISTDFVFDGAAHTPYEAHDVPAPRSAYGRTKLAGEWAVQAAGGHHLILRTAWLYGAHGTSFPAAITGLARRHGTVQVVTDQVGCPTWTMDVALLARDLVGAEVPAGIYHAVAAGQASKREFAIAAGKSAGLAADVFGEALSADFPNPAPRPAYSVLGTKSVEVTGVEPIGHWEERWRKAASRVLVEAVV